MTSTYYMNEGAFELHGGGFTDRTVHVLEARHPEHGEVSLIVRRADFPTAKSLRDLVKEHLERESKQLPGHAVLGEDPAEVEGAAALCVSSRFRHEGEVVYQRVAHLAVGESWMSFAMSAPLESRAACDAWLAQILGSVRLRADA